MWLTGLWNRISNNLIRQVAQRAHVTAVEKPLFLALVDQSFMHAPPLDVNLVGRQVSHTLILTRWEEFTIQALDSAWPLAALSAAVQARFSKLGG